MHKYAIGAHSNVRGQEKTKKEETDKKTHFVTARRNSDSTLSEFKDNNGKIYDYEWALEAIGQGMIENALPFTGRDGARRIRGINNGDESTSLRSLKEF